MERQSLEAKFTAVKSKLDQEVAEAIKIKETKGIEGDDLLRLTRVIQLVERYKPARRQEPVELSRWQKILSGLYRLMPGKQENKKQALTQSELPAEKVGPASFLLSERIVAILRELRHLDMTLNKEMEFFDDVVLNQERPNEIQSTETLDTSLTLDYEKKSWGVERVCLDGIQNHLPADSKGEKVWVRCLVGDRWVSLNEARLDTSKIKAVRFIDDGVGFDVKNLTLLYSTKSEEEESAGQFGEGMKMMSAAALREGLDAELESQDWRAKPVAKTVSLKDTRHGKTRKVQQLAFDVEQLGGEPMFGSRTTFWKPTEKFIAELMQIDVKVLALRDGYKPLFTCNDGQIVDKDPGGIYVKGIQVMKMRTVFSYNFDDVKTNRDRNLIMDARVDSKIHNILAELSDKRLIVTLLKKCQLDPDSLESSLYYLYPKHKKVWQEAFIAAFGADAVVDTNFDMPNMLRERPLNKIRFSSSFTQTLLSAGVRCEKDIIPDFLTEMLPTSLTMETGEETWGEERIMLDAVQNHLPRDCGGEKLGLRFKTKDGVWHEYGELLAFEDDQIAAIKIFDDGRGYDYRKLGLIHSDKEDKEAASGKFGEGLKMLAVAALRMGTDVSLYSRNWQAKPKSVSQQIDNKEVKQLCFDVTSSVKTKTMDKDDKQRDQSSATVFSNPSKALIQEFRAVNKKVLAIDNPTPIEKTSVGDILSTDNGLVYVRDILMTGNHHTLFSYHLKKAQVKIRERNLIPAEDLRPVLEEILSEVKSPEIIRAYLFKASRAKERVKGQQERFEFTFSFMPKHREVWKSVFEEVFGKDVAIRDIASTDFDALHQNQHVGLELVTVPSAVYVTLKELNLPTYESRLAELTDVEEIKNDELTEAERRVVSFLGRLDEYMPLPSNRPSEIVIYEKKKPDQKVAAGFARDEKVYLLREILSNLEQAADTYFHEKTHHNVGAPDAAAGFRNYLTMTLAKVALAQLEVVRPDLARVQN